MYNRLGRRHKRYPFVDIPLWAKQAVLNAIRLSFDNVISTETEFENENNLTAVLVDELNELRRDGSVAGSFSARYFQVVTRDGCSSTFDGKSLQKRPDMIFRLADSIDEYEGWFVECKIVNATHSSSLYFSKGVSRFVSGDYAWAMPSALMLAYADSNYSVESVSSLASQCQPSRLLDDLELHSTDHERSWTYPGSSNRAGTLRVFHLWLRGALFG